MKADPALTWCCLHQDPRRYSNVVSLRMTDFPKVPVILDELRTFLRKHPGVDKSLPVDANVAAMDSSTIQIGITVSLAL